MEEVEQKELKAEQREERFEFELIKGSEKSSFLDPITAFPPRVL